MAIPVLDAVIDWYPYDPPKRLLATRAVPVDAFVRMAEDFGVSIATALAPYATSVPTAGLTEAFADLCDRCAEVRQGSDPTWARDQDGDRVRWLCPPCTRRHLRDIEAKLAPGAW